MTPHKGGEHNKAKGSSESYDELHHGLSPNEVFPAVNSKRDSTGTKSGEDYVDVTDRPSHGRVPSGAA